MEIMTAIHAERKELSQSIASHRVTQALQRYNPSASMFSLKISDEVLVYRENPRQWVGPYRVLDVLEKIVHLDFDRRNVRFSIDEVKPYFCERGSSTAEDVVPSLRNESAAETTDRADIIQDLRTIIDGNNGSEVQPSPFGTSSTEILQTKVVDNQDPRSQSEMFRITKEKEICGLLSRKRFQAVHINNVPREAKCTWPSFHSNTKGIRNL